MHPRLPACILRPWILAAAVCPVCAASTGVNVYISVCDYGSGEATGSRWPRRPQASQVSGLSIPPRLLHSCENRKAARNNKHGRRWGAGGGAANLWLINNRSSLALWDFFLDCSEWLDLWKQVFLPPPPIFFSLVSTGHMPPAK